MNNEIRGLIVFNFDIIKSMKRTKIAPLLFNEEHFFSSLEIGGLNQFEPIGLYRV